MDVLFVIFGSILGLFMLGVFLFGLSACMLSSKISHEEEINARKREEEDKNDSTGN